MRGTCSRQLEDASSLSWYKHHGIFMFDKCILRGSEDCVEHFLEFCMDINDQRVALMTSLNIFLNSNDFIFLSMKVIYFSGCQI